MVNNPPIDVSAGSEAVSGVQAMPLHSTDLLTLLDEDGIIRYDSPSIKRIYGYEQDELVGHHVTEYFHPDDHDRVLAAFEALTTASDHHVEQVEHRFWSPMAATNGSKASARQPKRLRATTSSTLAIFPTESSVSVNSPQPDSRSKPNVTAKRQSDNCCWRPRPTGRSPKTSVSSWSRRTATVGRGLYGPTPARQ